MDVIEMVRRAVSLQEAFTLISLAISFTGYLFPQQAHVEGKQRIFNNVLKDCKIL